jgi:phosphoesterase RecJ-like protein
MITTYHSLITSPTCATAWQDIQKAQKITFLTHQKPDADGISACAALSEVMQALGKSVETVYPSIAEGTFYAQPANVFVNEHHQVPNLLIACDTANYERLYFPEEFKTISLINIDHHVSNKITGTHNFIASDVSSTCELVYFLLQAWDKTQITTHVASTLLFGILYDSQVFHTQSTYPSTLRVAADLIDKGAQLFDLTMQLLCNKNPHIIAFWGHLMQNIGLSPQGTAAWAIIHQKDLTVHNLKLDSLIGFSNFLAQISGVDVAILLYETEDGMTKVSMRSKKTDVNQIAKKFGGGGHIYASGILSEVPIDELAQQLTKEFA